MVRNATHNYKYFVANLMYNYLNNPNYFENSTTKKVDSFDKEQLLKYAI